MNETTTAGTFSPFIEGLAWTEFRAAVLFVAAVCDRTRGALPFASAVCIDVDDTGRAALVATDRYRLHVAEFDAAADAVPGRYLLPAVDLLTAIKPARIIGGVWSLALGAGSWSVTADRATVSGEYVAAEFPKSWRTLFPETPAAVDVLNITPALVGGSLAAIAKAYPKKTARVTLNGSARAFVVDGFADNARALLMPVRG